MTERDVEHSAESDAGLDPWGYPIPPLEALVFCDFIAPNRLPCTSRVKDHPAMHFTSDGRAWTHVLPPAERRTESDEAQKSPCPWHDDHGIRPPAERRTEGSE